MGACMEHFCSGCGFEYETLEALVIHERGCPMFMQDEIDRLREQLDRALSYKRAWESLAKQFYGMLEALSPAPTGDK